MTVKEVLCNYEKASGQAVNFSKSLICFSPNTGTTIKESISTLLNVEEHDNLGNYLGLPTAIGRNKQEMFAFIKDKVWKRLHSWKNRFLSKAGKEILIKMVLQAVPNYVMSLFLLTKGVCEEIEKMMSDFWWGRKDNGSAKLHWMSWPRLCNHKSQGGLQFKRLFEFNVSLLGRIGWRIIKNPGSLMAKILKARYFENCGFMEASLGANPSYVWRSILEGRKVLERGLCWRIGGGNSVSVWMDPWIPEPSNPFVETSFGASKTVITVRDLINNGRWDTVKIAANFEERDRNQILSIPLTDEQEDSLFWLLDKKRNLYR